MAKNYSQKKLDMKRESLFIIFILAGLGLMAQDFQVPEVHRLETEEDFRQYEPDVLEAIEWLKQTPVHQDEGIRQEANRFLLEWLMTNPYLSIFLHDKIVPFSDDPELLMIFMGGWTRYALEARDFDNVYKGNLNGVKAVIDFYQANRNYLETNRHIENLMEMQEKGELEDFVREHS